MTDLMTVAHAVEELRRSLQRVGLTEPESITLSSFDEGMKLSSLAVPHMTVKDAVIGWSAKPGFQEMKVNGMLFRWPAGDTR